MSKAAKFDSDFYISENRDVANAISSGSLESAIKHFELFGASESRAPNGLFLPNFYFINLPFYSGSENEGRRY